MQKFTFFLSDGTKHEVGIPTRAEDLNCETLFRVLAAYEKDPPNELERAAAWLNLSVEEAGNSVDPEIWDDIAHCIQWFDNAYLSSLLDGKLPERITLGLAEPIDLQKAKDGFKLKAYFEIEKLKDAPLANAVRIIALGLGVADTKQEAWVGSLSAKVGYKLLHFFLTGGSKQWKRGMLSRFIQRMTVLMTKQAVSRLSARLT